MIKLKNLFKKNKEKDRENFTIYVPPKNTPQKEPEKEEPKPLTPYQEYALAKEQYNRVVAKEPFIPKDFESRDVYAAELERVKYALELAEARIAEYEEAMNEMLDKEYEWDHMHDNDLEYNY